MMQFEQFCSAYRPLVIQAMQEQAGLFSHQHLKRAVMQLLGRGKLFRPLLAVACYEAAGGRDPKGIIPLVVPLEMIHTFTLIHDDLPCMDDAELRRGVTAVHLEYGEAAAVLAGDALQNLALYVLSSESPIADAEVRVRLIKSATLAIHNVVEGQMLDLDAETKQCSLAELEELHRKKTGALIGACCESGAILAGAKLEVSREFYSWGELLGLVFQIKDDLLSIEGSEAVVGKTLATDETRGKSTYPLVLGLDESKGKMKQGVDDLVSWVDRMQLEHGEILKSLAQYAGSRES